MDRRAVIECDEADSLIATAGTDPTFDVHLLSYEGGFLSFVGLFE